MATRAFAAGQFARPQRPRGRRDGRRLRRQRLVRRADARRRGRARRWRPRERPLLRRGELLRRRPARRSSPGRDRQQGLDRHQLVGRADVRRRRRRALPTIDQASWTPTRPSSSRAPSRASASTSPPATTATTSRPGATSIPTTRPATLGDLGRRHLASRSARTTRASGETGWGTTKYGLSANGKSWVQRRRVPLRRGRRLQPGLPAARGTRTASSRQPGAAPSRTSRMDADPTTGMLVGETQNFALPSASGRPASTTASTASAARASPRRSWPASRPSPSREPDGRIGFANPLHLLRSRRHVRTGERVLRRHAAGRPRQRPRRLRERHQRRRRHVFSVRTFDEDTSLTTARAGTTSPASAASPRATSFFFFF